jgi:hypothetical protein
MTRPTHAFVTRWTPKEVATAIRMYTEGHTFGEIAMRLKRSRGEVAGKLFRLRRAGDVVGRLVKERPPPREPRNPKPDKPRAAPARASPEARNGAAVRAIPPKPKPARRHQVTQQQPHPKISISRPLPPAPREEPPCCWELTAGECRFPIGRRGGDDGPMTFCAKTAAPGTSWCPDHHAVVYTRR